MRPVLIALASVLGWGCVTRADQAFVARGRLISGSSGAQPGYAIKMVRAKQAPSKVIGDDGSLCRLTADRFAHVEVGEWLACTWTIAPDTTAAIAQAGA
jgi:hypothetical protein